MLSKLDESLSILKCGATREVVLVLLLGYVTTAAASASATALYGYVVNECVSQIRDHWRANEFRMNSTAPLLVGR